MKIGTIVLDLDDTLCDFVRPALQKVETLTGYKHDYNEVTRRWVDDLPLEGQIVVKEQVFHPDFYSGLQLWKGHWPEFEIKGMVASMRRRHKVCILTARLSALGEHALPITTKWFDTLQVEVDDIKVCHINECKSTYFPPDTVAVVDDSEYVVTKAADLGLRAIMRDQPWNRQFRDTRVHRVFSPYGMTYSTLWKN